MGLIEEARTASEQGDPERARQLLTRAGQIAPDDPEVELRIGRVFLVSGDTTEAVKHLSFATGHGVDDPDAYLELARILLDAGRYDECQAMIDSALRLVPTHVSAQLLAGRLAELRHKDDEALEIYYRLLGQDPADTEATWRVADVLLRLGRSSQAAPLLRTIVASDGVEPSEQARARWSLGLIYGRDHRWAESAAQLSAAAAIKAPLTADDAYRVAYVSWEAGDRQRAHEFVTRTLAVSPQHPDALALWAALRQNDSASQTAYSRLPLPAPKAWQ